MSSSTRLAGIVFVAWKREQVASFSFKSQTPRKKVPQWELGYSHRIYIQDQGKGFCLLQSAHSTHDCNFKSQFSDTARTVFITLLLSRCEVSFRYSFHLANETLWIVSYLFKQLNIFSYKICFSNLFVVELNSFCMELFVAKKLKGNCYCVEKRSFLNSWKICFTNLLLSKSHFAWNYLLQKFWNEKIFFRLVKKVVSLSFLV